MGDDVNNNKNVMTAKYFYGNLLNLVICKTHE